MFSLSYAIGMAEGGAPARRRVYLDIGFETLPVGRVVLELAFDIAPVTSANFHSLCRAHTSNSSSSTASYKNSVIHRVVPGFVIQGGDITKGNGKGGKAASNVGKKALEKEREQLTGAKNSDHSGKYVLSMADCTSQFFITLRDNAHWLDREHVAFGKVVEGQDVVQKIEEKAGSQTGQPSKRVRVLECGVLEDDDDLAGAGLAGGGGLYTSAAHDDGDTAPHRFPSRVDATGESVHEESLRRLQHTVGVSGFGKPQQPQDSSAHEESHDGANVAADVSDRRADKGIDKEKQSDDAEEEDTLSIPPGEWENLSAQQKKLMQLRRKLNQSRKTNEKEVLGERKNQAGGSANDQQLQQHIAAANTSNEGWRKQWEEDANIMGLEQSKPHLLEPQESAEARKRCKQRKRASHMFDTSEYAPESHYREYNNRAQNHELTPQAAEHKKQQAPHLFSERSVLEYGEHVQDDPERIDAMVGELDKKKRKAEAQLRKRIRRNKEVDAVNPDNDAFNKEVDKSFSKHTQEIRQNLERGAAMGASPFSVLATRGTANVC